MGRVCALVSDTGEPIDTAGPRRQEVLALPARRMLATAWPWSVAEARARQVSDYRARQKREKRRREATVGLLEQMMAQAKTSGRKEFPPIIKAERRVRWKRSWARSTSLQPMR